MHRHEKTTVRGLFVSRLLTAMLLGCSSVATEPDSSRTDDELVVSDTIELVIELDPTNVNVPVSDSGSTPVKVGIFLYSRSFRHTNTNPTWSQEDAIEIVRKLMESSDSFASCKIHLELETAQIIDLPKRLLDVNGNEKGSWGGHPPDGTENPALFNYNQNERLTSETRELFGYGKRYTSPNTISVFVVKSITYYIGDILEGAGGLSFSPNIYHHKDDYPLRNSVLVTEPSLLPNGLPFISGFNVLVMAKEIEHMLLNTGLHKDWGSEYCSRMHEMISLLYGEAEVYDPGSPK